MIESPKLFTSRKKAVSFHGVEMPKLDDCMQWRLQLKRSSASTNVSLLNLAESDKEDSQDNDILSEPDVISETSETPILPEAEKECCAESSLDLTENTVLMKANDSISDLKMKNSKINQHVQSLKVECSALCENLELRHQEAEELENYCNQLEESCKRLNKCVEEAENKTNAMRLKSITLEEKLNSLYKKVEDAIGKREKQLKELEECVGDSITGLSDGEHLNHPQSQEEEAKTDDSQIADLCKTIESLLSAITGLQQSMEKDAQKTEKGKVVAAMETQDMKVCVAVLDDIRNNLFQLNSKHERESTLHKNVHRVVFHMNARFDSFLSQWERVQKEQTHMMENIQELQANADGIYSLVKKISLSYGQIRGELDAFWQVKPLLEEVSRNLSVMKTQDATDMSGARNNNANFNIRQMIDQAMAPLLEEIKNYTPHGACMDCQRMQKKVARQDSVG
ncbi:testis-specific serine kinase substrate isoform 2-T2 [Discoglossus pictus]